MWQPNHVYHRPKSIITVEKARELCAQDMSAFFQKLAYKISMGTLENENIGALSFEAPMCPKGFKNKHFVTCADGQITIHFDLQVIQFNDEPIFT
jgi:hypothetical protein